MRLAADADAARPAAPECPDCRGRHFGKHDEDDAAAAPIARAAVRACHEKSRPQELRTRDAVSVWKREHDHGFAREYAAREKDDWLDRHSSAGRPNLKRRPKQRCEDRIRWTTWNGGGPNIDGPHCKAGEAP